jgi:hypothetical protein
MKFRPLLVASLVALGAFAPAAQAQDPAVPAALHVVIRAHDPITFHQLRHGLADGKELILSTLRLSADQEAGYAQYPGDVVVGDEKTAPPEDAPVLRLTWTEDAVTAELLVRSGAKPVYLGVVSRSPLSEHPDYKAMRQEIDQSGSSDRQRDATVRAQTRLQLYLALLRAKREMRE